MKNLLKQVFKPASVLLIFGSFFQGCTPVDPLIQLEEAIQAKIQTSSGTFGIAFQDLEDTSKVLLINEHESFHAASTMKTPVMIEVFKQVQAGKMKLQDSILVKNEFYSIVDSSIYAMDIGEDSEEKLYDLIGQKQQLYDLMYDMITYSSNLATNIIIDLVDAKKVTATMRTLGAPDIQVLRGVEDIKAYEKGLSNSTTAYDLMAIYRAMGQKKILDEAACNEMIQILLDQKFNDQIPALLPEGVKVAHKTGWISTAAHDSGIIILPDGRQYTLTILTKNWESSETNTKTMAEISKLVYDYYINSKETT